MQAEHMSRTSRGMAAVGALAATVGLAVATNPAGAQAEVVTPHAVTPQVITPHAVAPPASTPAPAPSQAPAEDSAPVPSASQPDAAAPAPKSSASGSRGSRRERGAGGNGGSDQQTGSDDIPDHIPDYMGGLNGWPGSPEPSHWAWDVVGDHGLLYGILVEWWDVTTPAFGFGPDIPAADDGEKWTSIGNKLDAAAIELQAPLLKALHDAHRPVTFPPSPAAPRDPGTSGTDPGTGDPGSGTSQGGSPVGQAGGDDPTGSDNDPFGIEAFFEGILGGNQGGSGIGPDVKKVASF